MASNIQMSLTMETSFLSSAEVKDIGFKRCGDDVLLSRKVSIYKAHEIEIGSHVRIDDFCILSGGSGLSIGNYVHISAYCCLYAGAGITIEDFSNVSARTALYSESDDFSGESLIGPTIQAKFKPYYKRGAVLLKRHVNIGVNSTIMPGVTLQEGVAVGAHSLVNKDCESWSIYAGVPAKRLRSRSRALLELERQLLSEQPI